MLGSNQHFWLFFVNNEPSLFFVKIGPSSFFIKNGPNSLFRIAPLAFSRILHLDTLLWTLSIEDILMGVGYSLQKIFIGPVFFGLLGLL